MSTLRTNAILDSAGGNTATINGITPALSSQAQAEAGTDNTTQMTPLRVANSIAVNAVPDGSITTVKLANSSVGAAKVNVATGSTAYNFPGASGGTATISLPASVIHWGQTGTASANPRGTVSAPTVVVNSSSTTSGSIFWTYFA